MPVGRQRLQSNYGNLQLSIDQTLRDFLAIEYRAYFAHDFSFVYRGLVYESQCQIEGNELVSQRKCDHLDLGAITQIEQFVDELSKWNKAVTPLREEWFSDHWGCVSFPIDLNLREVFGDEICNDLEDLRSRCRRILRHVERTQRKRDPILTNDAIWELLKGRLNRVGKKVCGSDVTIRSWQKRKKLSKQPRWSELRKFLDDHKNCDIGEPPQEC